MTDTVIIDPDLSFNRHEPILIHIQHNELNTHLECTGLSDYYLLSGDQDGQITGISFISNSERGTFGIVTQAKVVLLLPISIEIEIKSIKSISY
jgi:hypothetical protein